MTFFDEDNLDQRSRSGKEESLDDTWVDDLDEQQSLDSRPAQEVVNHPGDRPLKLTPVDRAPRAKPATANPPAPHAVPGNAQPRHDISSPQPFAVSVKIDVSPLPSSSGIAAAQAPERSSKDGEATSQPAAVVERPDQGNAQPQPDHGQTDRSVLQPDPHPRSGALEGEHASEPVFQLGHMYWILEQARLVTHGFFSDYIPSRPTGMESEIVNAEIGATDSQTVLVLDSQMPTSSKSPGQAARRDDPHRRRPPAREREKTRLLESRSAPPPKPKLNIAMPKSGKSEQAETGEIPGKDNRRAPISMQPGYKRPIRESASDQAAGSHAFANQLKQHFLLICILIVVGTISGAVAYLWLRPHIADGLARIGKRVSKGAGVLSAPPRSDQKAQGKKTAAPPPDSELALALQLEQEHKYDEALLEYNGVIAKQKTPSAEALHGRGRVLSQLQKLNTAKEDLEKAAALAPGNANILVDLAGVNFLLGDYKTAIEDYDRVLQMDKENYSALYGRGISHAALEDYNEAIADFEEVVRLKPAYSEAYRQMARVYMSMGVDDRAEAVTTIGIKVNKSDENLYFTRALAKYKLGRKEAAVEDYNEAVRLGPSRKEFYNDRGYVLMELGRYQKARADFRRALQLDPAYEMAAENLGTLEGKIKKSAH